MRICDLDFLQSKIGQDNRDITLAIFKVKRLFKLTVLYEQHKSMPDLYVLYYINITFARGYTKN